MRLATAMAVAAVAVVAAPAIGAAEPCDVIVARAPDGVREAVEEWIRGESRCGPPLTVRIVPVDGGLYVYAEDASGKVRERMVPDGQTVAVLIASWTADDTVVQRPALRPIDPFAKDRVALAPIDPFVAAAAKPGAKERPAPDRVPANGVPGDGVAVGFAAMKSTREAMYGGRSELDIKRDGRRVVGATIAMYQHTMPSPVPMASEFSFSGQLHVGYDHQPGRFGIRGQASTGVLVSGGGDNLQINPIAEAALTFGVRATDRLGFRFGPIASFVPPGNHVRGAIALGVFGGAHWELR